MTRETVWCETPASFATSVITAARRRPLRPSARFAAHAHGWPGYPSPGRQPGIRSLALTIPLTGTNVNDNNGGAEERGTCRSQVSSARVPSPDRGGGTMSELDPVNDALERLEWQDAREEETPQSRLKGDDPARGADRRRGGDGEHRDRGMRRRRQQARERARRRAARRPAASSRARAAEVRARQPRDDEPVLRADPLRRRGRLQAARLQLPVHRFQELQRQRDGQRVQHRRHQRRRRDRGAASSTRRRSTSPSTRR